jgi:hypothetical protein
VHIHSWCPINMFMCPVNRHPILVEWLDDLKTIFKVFYWRRLFVFLSFTILFNRLIKNPLNYLPWMFLRHNDKHNLAKIKSANEHLKTQKNQNQKQILHFYCSQWLDFTSEDCSMIRQKYNSNNKFRSRANKMQKLAESCLQILS